MGVTLPGWYHGGFPDVERLMESLFTPLIGGCDIVPWFPKPAEYVPHLENGGAYLRAARTGGSFSFDENRDEPRVQIAALSKSRAQSWEIIEFVRQTLWTFKRGALVPGTETQLQTNSEVLGPQLIPENIVEPRLVPATFALHTWKPGQTNYRQALGL